MKHKLSIITVNLNNVAGLRKTINSIINQTFKDFEYIIVDGGSDDGSVKLIKEYSDKIHHWVSEPDAGIYHAMNKGIEQANGEYCLFINSGDIFIKTTILNEMLSFANGEDILYGNGFFEARNNEMDKLECPDKLTLGFFILYCLLHPSTLIKRSLFDKYGLYNESNKIVSDWEFFIKTTILNNVKTKFIPLEVSISEDNGISRNTKFTKILEEERSKILNNFFPEYVIDLMIDYKNINSRNISLMCENNKLNSEIKIYKKYKIFRAVLKMVRLIFPKFILHNELIRLIYL